MTIELIKIIFREKSSRKCQMRETSLTGINIFLVSRFDGKYQGFGKRTTLVWTKFI